MCMFMMKMSSKLTLKYLMQNCTLLLTLKSLFMLFIMLLLILTTVYITFVFNINQWYISFSAAHISRPDSKELCPVKPARLGKVLYTHLHHVNYIISNYMYKR